jgi:hypothetical protein
MSKQAGHGHGRWRSLAVTGAILCALASCSDKKDAPSGPVLQPDAGAPHGGNGGGGSTAADPRACEPGTQRTCRQDIMCTGVATCAADGSGFGACACGATPLEEEVAPDVPGIVGAACDADTDCKGGALCLRASGTEYGGGGPAAGYCTFECAATSDCQALDPQSGCGNLGNTSYCFRTCLSLDPVMGENKCLNRTDVVCFSEAAGGMAFTGQRQDGYCTPLCGSDADCPSGRFCHRQGGVCTPFPSPGAESGSRCELDSDCDGQMCENRVNGVGICTAPCVLGSLAGCGYAEDAPVRDVACLTPLVAAGRFSEGVGDLGLCRELCDVDTDCSRAADGLVCKTLNAGASEFFGRPGACAAP